ncbi:MAG: two-component system response regulator [Gracilibacter sp. BRH_c7a]|nr:MAG: two-component system response regulator [Gracilibacter sp. BRH_c7a]
MSNKIRILVAEDESKMRDLISLYLRKENYDVLAVEDGLQGLNELEKGNNFDLYIIDVMMPKLDGFGLSKEIRQFSDSPIIFVTARGEEYERLLGFELGADDYLTKPFSPRELIARVKAILKRTSPDKEQNLIINEGNIYINTAAREVQVAGETIILTPKEFDLLVYLIRSKGKVLSREQITEQVWDYDYYGDQRTVDTHIKKLRDKLGKDSQVLIKTIWGVGYKVEVTL